MAGVLGPDYSRNLADARSQSLAHLHCTRLRQKDVKTAQLVPMFVSKRQYHRGEIERADQRPRWVAASIQRDRHRCARRVFEKGCNSNSRQCRGPRIPRLIAHIRIKRGGLGVVPVFALLANEHLHNFFWRTWLVAMEGVDDFSKNFEYAHSDLLLWVVPRVSDSLQCLISFALKRQT